MKYIEIEQKFVLHDADALRAKLREIDARPTSPRVQRDTYLRPPYQTMEQVDQLDHWLRVRQEDDGSSSINFKRKLDLGPTSATNYHEYESRVTDAEAVLHILDELDFVRIVEVRKTREEWDVSSQIVAAIDTIDGIGSFVEFEFVGDADSPQEALNQLTQFVGELKIKLGDQINVGYAQLKLRQS
ncbi:class IV adenylate cyclase [Micromonospora sp. WMMD1128]|uniref:class IV adenylate cyclase n=1 Tax=Micromonospora sp. WMMD1128 TaxID=3015150 RepID=UPI00248C8645|nr:class IV adenylate cyclase [Micromonospora sp. WMMD1128]WBB74744.1 class IV adenylate cyclase [Micromonospora sp. WMMD1128]